MTETESKWAKSSSVFEPSDDAATYWRTSEKALSLRLQHKRGRGRLLDVRLEQSRARESPVRASQNGGWARFATNPVRMRVSLVYIAVIVGMLAIALAITLLALRVARRRRDMALRRHGAPKLVMPLIDSDQPVAPRPAIPREEWSQRSSPHSVPRIRPASPMSARTITPIAHQDYSDSEPDVLIVPESDHVTVSTGPFRPSDARPGSPSAHLVEGAQLRFFRAEEGTLEFLPGRLEVVGGEDIGQEIHFARQVGDDDVTVTFGRSEGPPLRHVQLLDPTVSRQHARMTFAGQRWHLSNISTTNAVLLNGGPLPEHGNGITLQDGDRLEMGAVVFVFHAR